LAQGGANSIAPYQKSTKQRRDRFFSEFRVINYMMLDRVLEGESIWIADAPSLLVTQTYPWRASASS